MLFPKYERFCSFSFGGVTLTSPLTLEFETTYKNRWVPAQTIARIYNPNPMTIAAAGTKILHPVITIIAGYKADAGIAVIGTIKSFQVKKTGVDRVLELQIGDATQQWANGQISRTFPPGVTASVVASALIAAGGLVPASIIPAVDKTYSRGITFNTSFRRALGQIARDTRSELFIRNGQIALQPRALRGTFPPVVLTPEEILKVEKTKNGYKVDTFYNYKIQAGTPVTVPSINFSGNLKVLNAKSNFSMVGNAATSFEGKVIA